MFLSSKKSRVRASAFALATAALLGACGSSSSSGGDDEASAGASSAAADLPVAAVLATSTGGQIDFGDLAGQDAILWFWAPW